MEADWFKLNMFHRVWEVIPRLLSIVSWLRSMTVVNSAPNSATGWSVPESRKQRYIKETITSKFAIISDVAGFCDMS
jgi:hypothetical protein